MEKTNSIHSVMCAWAINNANKALQLAPDEQTKERIKKSILKVINPKKYRL